MFTGIIECKGRILEVSKENSNYIFTVNSDIGQELKIDQSVAHEGVCLTVVEVKGNDHKVVAIKETIDKTSLAEWKVGREINLERCMQMNGRLDGHIVQGHVDGTAKLIEIENNNGSWKFFFELFEPEKFNHLMVEKGSICINGVSLTLVTADTNKFSVAIIPYTFENTSFCNLAIGNIVNIEFDIIGKYVQKMMNK
ncbi:MAG: riboflavin synthase [Bacteroidota bacterium]|jgi:riboflavin synthase